ncbi:MAG TPA: glycosyltransferase family 1 protein [Thermoanaerobaculia bacterium]
MSEKLRVVIDARLSTGRSGGIEQIVIGLASGLAEVAQPGDEYVFLLQHGDDSWLRPYLGGPFRIVKLPRDRRDVLRSAAKRVPGAAYLHQVWKSRHASKTPVVHVPRSPGIAESLEADVVHFPTTAAYLTSVPSIYHPWDLQHIHYPEFFAHDVWVTRDRLYREFCARAAVVSVATEWGKQDLVQHFGLDPAKVEVVPVAPVVTAYPVPTAEDLERVRNTYRLPAQFAYFPAHTWPHKNHLAVIQAVHLLRDRGVTMHVVFTGGETKHARQLRAEVDRLGLRSQIHFLGFVPPLEVQCLYRLATCMIFPSRFEGWGLPVPEAFHSDLPVAASNASCLPEVTAGAALLFDPDDVEAIAGAMQRLSTDESLRQDLIRRGREVSERLSWVTTARRFRELYARVARTPRVT